VFQWRCEASLIVAVSLFPPQRIANYMKYNVKRIIAFHVVVSGCGVSVYKREAEQVSWERRGNSTIR